MMKNDLKFMMSLITDIMDSNKFLCRQELKTSGHRESLCLVMGHSCSHRNPRIHQYRYRYLYFGLVIHYKFRCLSNKTNKKF